MFETTSYTGGYLLLALLFIYCFVILFVTLNFVFEPLFRGENLTVLSYFPSLQIGSFLYSIILGIFMMASASDSWYPKGSTTAIKKYLKTQNLKPSIFCAFALISPSTPVFVGPFDLHDTSFPEVLEDEELTEEEKKQRGREAEKEAEKVEGLKR